MDTFLVQYPCEYIPVLESNGSNKLPGTGSNSSSCIKRFQLRFPIVALESFENRQKIGRDRLRLDMHQNQSPWVLMVSVLISIGFDCIGFVGVLRYCGHWDWEFWYCLLFGYCQYWYWQPLVLKVLVLVKKVLVLIAIFPTECCVSIITQTGRILWFVRYEILSSWIWETRDEKSNGKILQESYSWSYLIW